MDHSFFMNNWAAPLRHRYHPQPTAPSPSPKVVSIPVQFVGPVADHPRPLDPSAAAVRIQKAARGFLVRKNMSTVRKIAGEAEEIARRIEISAEEIRRDDRERLRVGEMLMALLLRLDSVRGVRDYRKTVIRRVIQLQETVDSITTNTNNAAAEEATESEEAMMEESKAEEAMESEAMMEGTKVNDAGMDSVDEVPDCAWPEEEEEAAMEEAEAEPEEKPVELTEDGPQGLELALEKLVGLQEVMERTVAESEQMKGLVTVLCERSAQQCQLMNGLVQRVEQLERRVQSMERKKKKRHAANHSNALNKKE